MALQQPVQTFSKTTPIPFHSCVVWRLLFCLIFLDLMFVLFSYSSVVVSTGAIDCVERLVCKMVFVISSGIGLLAYNESHS